MHQTFYIDIDEEITSIVERLKKSRSNEVVLVVPKRALLIQSIVNLRLLKKEAEKSDRLLSIVTQDPLGKVLIEKAGILVSQKIIEAEDNFENSDNQFPGDFSLDSEKEVIEGLEAHNLSSFSQKEDRQIGSQSYYDYQKLDPEDLKKQEEEKRLEKISKENQDGRLRPDFSEKEKPEPLVNRELVVGGSMDIKRKDPSRNDVFIRSKKEPESFLENAKPEGENFIEDKDQSMTSGLKQRGVFMSRKNPCPSAVSPSRESDPFFGKKTKSSGDVGPKNEKLEKFFSHSGDAREVSIDMDEGGRLTARFKKTFLFFGFIFSLVAFMVLGYLFVPKAEVSLKAKMKNKSVDSEVLGSSDYAQIDYEKEIIPVRLVSENFEVTERFSSTGNRSVSNKKARGKIIIYNEFSSSPQPLVATTRFESEDGRIFRLVSGVSVPGSVTEEGEIVPGKLEVEVVADEAGEQYNVEPGKFTIPGFKNSGPEKYSKIYALSEKAMSGGGEGGEDIKTVSESDISNAKNKLLEVVLEKSKQEIKSRFDENMMVLEDCIEAGEANYKISAFPGEAVGNFEVTVEVKIDALVFSEADLKNLANRIIARSGGVKTKMESSGVSLEYGKSDPDFQEGAVRIRFRASNEADSGLDLELIKKDILGKKDSELEEYFRKYSDVENVEISYWPSFYGGRIPSYAKRVEVRLDRSENSR